MRGQQPHDFGCYVGGGLLFYLVYKCVFACMVDQRHQESPMANSAHKIRFPVADACFFFHNCRMLVDVDPVQNFAALVLLPTVAYEHDFNRMS